MTTLLPCAKCGAALQADSSFCQICGAATGVPQPAGPMEILREALKDRYRVERELGKGGMATVFLAHDLRHERDVAIKVLHQELAASMGAERFEREIKLSAKLQHPHILGLFDSGVADGLLFYVMPFVQGESLRDRLDREQMLPLDDALTITLEVAEALGYAHGLGIVHRDIKPENIMLSGGHALVADFGIARAVTGAATEQKLTQTGSAIGTPLYMSPEQASGDEVGPTSDLYSLGCVAYEMLTGGPPFTGANARAIMARHTMEMVPSLRVVRDTVPDYVEDAIFAVMNKVPADRPKNAARFAAMLTGGEAVTTAGRAATRARMTAARLGLPAEAKPRFPRWAMAAIAVAAVLVGAGVAWKVRQPAATTSGLDPRHLAVLYFDDLSSDHSLGYLADGLTEGLIRALARADLNVAPKSGAALFRGTSAPDDSIAHTLQAGTLVKGSVETQGTNVRVQFQLVDGAGQSTIVRKAFALPAANGLAIENALVDSVSRAVRTALRTEVRQRAQRQQTSSTDAWVLVQRAEQARKQADSAAAADDTLRYATLIARADSQAAQAEQLDDDWVTPITQRAALAYGRARRYFAAAEAGPWIDIGLGHVQRALAKDDEDPDALELRGNLRYWAFLLGYTVGRLSADSLLVLARADLENAVRVEPAQAGAWASLSHLYANDPTKRAGDMALAAQEALRRDAFLANAPTIQARLFFARYDGGDFVKADTACAEGYRRFPDNPRFTECRLWMLTTTRFSPREVATAWGLADTMVLKSQGPDSAYQRLAGRIIVAGALARAGLTDSATKVISSVRRNSELDPSAELANTAAFVYTLLGEKQKALQQLTDYVNANPQRRRALADDPGWWFRPLENESGFRVLVASGR